MKLWVFAVLLSGCSESVSAHVNCLTTAAPAVECTVTQSKGKSEIEACWDFSVTCDNGSVVTAPRTCAKVKDGGTEKVTIPGDKLTGIDKCGGSKPPTPKLENLTLNGKASNN
ncbi:MAG: hypothetical protein WKG01_06510 [Kofleriaceae bacterium]